MSDKVKFKARLSDWERAVNTAADAFNGMGIKSDEVETELKEDGSSVSTYRDGKVYIFLSIDRKGIVQ